MVGMNQGGKKEWMDGRAAQGSAERYDLKITTVDNK
jgi:hypothetical protein